MFAVCARRRGALVGVAAVRLDLLERGHARGRVVSSASEVVRFRPLRRARIFSGAPTSTAGAGAVGSAATATAASFGKRVIFQSLSAVARASMPSLDHQAGSLRAR